jgi:2OG-Fe(II) oxygenase superfamily
MPDLPSQFAGLLRSVRTPGDFCMAGRFTMPMPRIEVQGVGPIALPLLPVQGKQLVAIADRAPYGRGAETLVDTTVRRTWQIGPERLTIKGRHWADSLAALAGRAAAGLGVAGEVAPELYKLLVYDEGSFFVSHRDTEKAPGMFATLIVVLPSLHEGGELLVRHQSREVRLGLQCPDPSEAAYAAFYADCVHEVLPVTSGCRLALVYNLIRPRRGAVPKPPDYSAEQEALAALLQRWSHARAGNSDALPEKLVHLLEHAYTPAGLSFDGLKGADAAAAGVLAAAAAQAGCELHAALLTIEETGGAYECGSDEFEIVEVDDRVARLSNRQLPDGSAALEPDLPFLDAELSPPGSLDTARIDICIAMLGDPERSVSAGDIEPLLQALGCLPLPHAAAQIEHLIAARARRSPGICAELLERAVAVQIPARGLGAAARRLVDALPFDTAQSAAGGVMAQHFDGRETAVDSGFVVRLFGALVHIDGAPADRAAGHLLASPATYGLDAVIVPALRSLAASEAVRLSVAVQRLRQACLQHLRRRIAQPLAPPADWSRNGRIECRGKVCNDFNRFLASPIGQTWTYKAAEFERSQVAAAIGRAGCDVDCKTDRRGRPYTLVCTKNQASYERRAKQREQDLVDLALLQ